MAKTATIFTKATLSGDGETDTYLSDTFTNSDSPWEKIPVSLSSGNNTLTPPVSPVAKGLIIDPPSSNGQTLTLKGANGDTGIAISPNSETTILFPSTGPGTIVLNAGGAVVVRLIWF